MFLSIKVTRSTLAACALSLAGAAHADFTAALKDYSAGHFDTAHAQFLSLAELGDCSSQFNLGAMALKGQGGPQDRGAGAGWLEAALSNGCRQLVGDRLPALLASLTPEQSRTAQEIVSRYGHDALQAEGAVSPSLECQAVAPASVIDAAIAEYPLKRAAQNPEGIVIAALTIGTDGHARDPQVLLSVPKEAFPAAAVEAWLNSHFRPAMRSGIAVESRLQAKLRFIGTSGSLAKTAVYQAGLPAAEAGDPAAQYLVGLTATLEPTLGVAVPRADNMLIDSARAGDADAQYWVALQVRSANACHPQGNWLLWLRHAAEGGSAAAAADYAAELLRGTPSAEQVTQARALLERAAASTDYYARKHAVALLAASPIEAVRDPQRARAGADALLHANEIQSDPQMFEVVAVAYAASHEYASAVDAQHKAIQKALNLGWNTTLMDERLAAYRHDAPWVGDLYAAVPGQR
jgi:TPR repeat protein